MSTKLLVSFSVAMSLLVAGPEGRVPTGTERACLRAVESGELASQRAGASDSVPLQTSERAALEQLQRSDLAAQRAAGLSNNDLSTILLVLGIVALLIIIF